MVPIHELLAKIRWDPQYGQADFVIGYLDHVSDSIVRVNFSELHFDPQDHFGFACVDDNGEVRHIPYHRVKEVYRNGTLIWQRRH
jgi:uncharacterized protein (UPF0248 family)